MICIECGYKGIDCLYSRYKSEYIKLTIVFALALSMLIKNIISNVVLVALLRCFLLFDFKEIYMDVMHQFYIQLLDYLIIPL